MDYDFPALLHAAKRAAAAYIPDDAEARQAFADLGCTVLDRISTTSIQAVAHRLNGRLCCDMSGTEVSEGSLMTRLTNILEDAGEFFVSRDLGGGVMAASGPYDSAVEIWAWLKPIANGEPIWFGGHSLGGGRTADMMAVVQEEQYAGGVSFEGIKAFNDAGWDRFAPQRKRLVHIVHGLDPWAAHPVGSDLQWTPEPILWLGKGGGFSTITRDQWPGPTSYTQAALGVIEHGNDHDISRVIAALERLAA